MRLSVSYIFLAALSAAGLFMMPAVYAQTPAPPKIAPARQISFTPQTDTAWDLEGSMDGNTYTKIAGPFFATGGPVEYAAPAGTAKFFRLKFVDPATIGFAPVTLTRTTAMLDRDGLPVEMVFSDGDKG